MYSEMDPFCRDGGSDPPHQPYSYPAAPPPFVPVKILRSSTQNKILKQSKIPISWHTRSNDQQSRPARRPISASFGPVAIFKTPKPTEGNSKSSCFGQPWTADESRITLEEGKKGESWESTRKLIDRTLYGVQKESTKVTNIWLPRTTGRKAFVDLGD